MSEAEHILYLYLFKAATMKCSWLWMLWSGHSRSKALLNAERSRLALSTSENTYDPLLVPAAWFLSSPQGSACSLLLVSGKRIDHTAESRPLWPLVLWRRAPLWKPCCPAAAAYRGREGCAQWVPRLGRRHRLCTPPFSTVLFAKLHPDLKSSKLFNLERWGSFRKLRCQFFPRISCFFLRRVLLYTQTCGFRSKRRAQHRLHRGRSLFPQGQSCS